MHTTNLYNILDASQALRRDVLLACKIIVQQQLDSGPFGNISIRIPGTQTFWVNPAGLTFEQLDIHDIVCADIDGNLLDGKHTPHPGTFIHREIYRLRSDVDAIVHTHSENTVMMSLLGCTIDPITQLGAAIYNDQGVYHGFTGPVRTSNEGTAIAQALAQKSLVIAKNHGIFTTGTTIQTALWDMIIVDIAAKIHLTAKQLGLSPTEKLPDEDMQKSRIEVRQKQCEFMWHAYLQKMTTGK
ncbi:MAG: hypothetical protein A3E83_00930 [Gammaproteobacteria bacterium RIFCSPHIGHO2_12_FULL_41_20]|nr:MAG: hypothetical protein A3E83_00930 [Gammaproteobacteria bacterium RIFCSPHIGHO2_12_FULL_41_20]